MAYEAKAGTKTIKGWVLAIEWDEDDMPTAVVIQTEDGTEYLVEETELADGLLELEDAQVEVAGQVDESDPDGPTMTVASFEVIDDSVEWEEDEEAEEGDLPPDAEDLSDEEEDEDEDEEDDWEEEDDEDDEDEEGDEDD